MNFFIVPLVALGFMTEPLNVKGNINYVKGEGESLIARVDLDYKIKLFEPDSELYMWYIGGTIIPDYDCFGKVLKINAFTNFGIEF